MIFKPKYIPRQYQIEGTNFLKSRRFAMLGDACGVGKTGQAITGMSLNWQHRRILIVCPASVKTQWQQAFLDWRGWHTTVINSSKDKINNSTSFYIVNYDLLFREPLLSKLLKLRFDLIVYDEAHKLKSVGAKRTKVALSSKYLRPRTDRIWFLTGTPVKNRTIDLYPILRSCAPEVLGAYDSYYKFAYRYCGAYKGRFGVDTSGASHTEELCERLKRFMLRREKRDVLTELPPRVISKVDLECTPAVRKVIEEEEYKTIEQAGEDDPGLFKLGEIARVRQALAKHKVPVSVNYIKDLLEEEDKIVVFYYHKKVLSELQRALQTIPSVFIDGSVPPNRRGRIVEKFRTGKEVRLFFGQMEACGEGIDGLQAACSCCVFVEPSWSHTDIEQCIGRLEREGQRNDINVHILTIKDTLEARMMDVVAMKLNVDKKLYNQTKELNMAPKKEPVAKVAENILVTLTAVMDKLVDLLAVMAKQQSSNSVSVPVNTLSEPQVVEAVGEVEVAIDSVEEDVTEDAIRARAGDISAIAPNGSGKAGCVAIIKKVGGGKIADLKTPKQRIKCLAALDALYNELAM